MPDDAVLHDDTLTSVERALERLHRQHAEMEREIGQLHMLVLAARSERDYLRGRERDG